LVALAREAAASSERLAEGLADARREIDAARVWAAEWQGRVVFWVYASATAHTLVWLWVGLGQLCLIGWGRRRISSRGPTPADTPCPRGRSIGSILNSSIVGPVIPAHPVPSLALSSGCGTGTGETRHGPNARMGRPRTDARGRVGRHALDGRRDLLRRLRRDQEGGRGRGGGGGGGPQAGRAPAAAPPARLPPGAGPPPPPALVAVRAC